MGWGVGGRSPRRGGRSGRSERANALPEGGAAAKRGRAPLPSLFLRATPAPPPRRPSPLRARPPQPRAPEARAVPPARAQARRRRRPLRPPSFPAASQTREREAAGQDQKKTCAGKRPARARSNRIGSARNKMRVRCVSRAVAPDIFARAAGAVRRARAPNGH